MVEDDFDARVLMRRVLEDAGAEVTGASDVDAAIECIDVVRPAVVVSDIALPHQDGYDLIRRIRERYRADVLPAIALTAFAPRRIAARPSTPATSRTCRSRSTRGSS